jgi:hypothetical protein
MKTVITRLFPLLCAGAALLPIRAAAEPPTQEALNSIRLPDSYTLLWRGSERHLPNQETVRVKRQSGEAMIAEQLKSKQISAAEAADLRKKIAQEATKVVPPRTFKTTLAARSGRLLFEVSGGGPMTLRAVYDGKITTRHAASTNASQGDYAYVDKGFHAGLVGPVPVLPADLPGLDVLHSAKPGTESATLAAKVPLLDANSNDGQLIYADAHLTATQEGGLPKVTAMQVTLEGNVLARWDYADHVRFRDVWLPKQVTCTAYYGTEKGNPLPDVITAWTLEDSSTTPLAEARFTPENWMKDHTGIQDTTTGNLVSFVYQKKQGALKDQMYAILNGVNLTAPQTAPPPILGLVLVVVLAGVISTLWGRIQGKRAH